MNLSKIFRVASREFASTAMTKGFIIGAIVVPAAMVPIIFLVMMLSMNAQPPADNGTIYILDPSSEVTSILEDRLDPEQVRVRWKERFQQISDAAKSMIPQANTPGATSAIDKAADSFQSPNIRVISAGSDTNIDQLKEELRQQVASQSSQTDEIERILGVIEIDADATRKINPEEGFGSYQAFLRPKLNEETVSEIENSVEWSIREKRYENAGIDRNVVSEISRVESRKSQEITADGERGNSSGLSNFAIPFGSMLLLLIATMTGGQYLLTTTIEEKSNRVVEVLLSALSPMELMTGKILGQMGVGLSLLLIYNSVGILALVVFGLGDLMTPGKVILFFVYFILAYFMFASLMAAIGSAVNDLREAQSLMTPVMLMMFVPYIFFMPVIRAPNSLLSTVMSFIPPISPFIMIMRVSSNDPPPMWQVGASIFVNMIGVMIFLWVAAKVFRVGLLMYGKPPNLRTLFKWVRMA